jgi:radical SAM-linked protein
VDDEVVGLRLRYAKAGKIRFTSQRDVARMWERALRRSRLPVAWSAGFSPHPLLSFGLALPTGAESLGEYLDVRLESAVLPAEDLAALPEWLSDLLPEGIEVQCAVALLRSEGSLQQEVTSCSWTMEVLGVSAVELVGRIERMLAAACLPVTRERKGRQVEDDLRPSVLSLELADEAAGEGPAQELSTAIRAELATQPRGVRPVELVSGLGADLRLARACRTHQWIEHDGIRREPLPLQGASGGPRAQHAHRRAS